MRVNRDWRIPILLGCLCLTLLGVLGLELWNVSDPERSAAAAPASPAALPERPDAGSFEPLPSTTFAELVERPLFNRSRRPIPRAAAGGDGTSDGSASALVVTGVLLANQRRVAILQAKGAPQQVRAEVGQDVNGWLVQAIEPNKVTLKKGDRTEEIVLADRNPFADKTKKPKAKRPPAPAAAQEPSQAAPAQPGNDPDGEIERNETPQVPGAPSRG